MIIIGEKINGAIPSIKEAIANRDEALIRERVQVQLPAKPDFLDCAPATEPALEYDAMKWLIGIMEEETDTPLCLDSPDPLLLKRLLEEGATQRPGCINSVNEEGTKCETLFPIIAGTDWNVIGLTCDQDGIPLDPDKKIEIAKRIIDKADKFGVALGNLHIDPCVMSLSTVPNCVEDLCTCIRAIKEYAPEVKVTAAISNVGLHGKGPRRRPRLLHHRPREPLHDGHPVRTRRRVRRGQGRPEIQPRISEKDHSLRRNGYG